MDQVANKSPGKHWYECVALFTSDRIEKSIRKRLHMVIVTNTKKSKEYAKRCNRRERSDPPSVPMSLNVIA